MRIVANVFYEHESPTKTYFSHLILDGFMAFRKSAERVVKRMLYDVDFAELVRKLSSRTRSLIRQAPKPASLKTDWLKRKTWTTVYYTRSIVSSPTCRHE